MEQYFHNYMHDDHKESGNDSNDDDTNEILMVKMIMIKQEW